MPVLTFAPPFMVYFWGSAFSICFLVSSLQRHSLPMPLHSSWANFAAISLWQWIDCLPAYSSVDCFVGFLPLSSDKHCPRFIQEGVETKLFIENMSIVSTWSVQNGASKHLSIFSVRFAPLEEVGLGASPCLKGQRNTGCFPKEKLSQSRWSSKGGTCGPSNSFLFSSKLIKASECLAQKKCSINVFNLIII